MLRELPSVVLVVGLIPLLWSAIVFALRAGLARGRPSIASMRIEVMLLAVLAAPVLLGATALVAAPLVPDATLPALSFEDVGWLAEPASAGATESTMAPDGAAAPDPAASRIAPLLALAAAAIYLAGLGASVARLLLARLRLDCAVRRSVPEPQLGAGVRITGENLPPFASVCGAIVLPRALIERMRPRELALVVAHERAHLDRGDPGAFWALAWVDALFWLNPFVRRQTGRCRLAAELACDALVLADTPGRRGDYARALVAAVRHTAAGPCLAPSVLSTRSSGEHQMRLTRIMSAEPAPRSRLARTATVAAALLVVPVGGLQLAACAARDEPAAAQNREAAYTPESALTLAITLADKELVGPGLYRVRGSGRITSAEQDNIASVEAQEQLVYLWTASEPDEKAKAQAVRIAGAGAWIVSGVGNTPHVETGEQMRIGMTCEGDPTRSEGAICAAGRPAAAPPLGPRGEVGVPDLAMFTVSPLEEGRITSLHGPRADPITREPRQHAGIDLGARRGAPVHAPAGGRVTYVGWRGGYGRVVELDHGGEVKTRYANLDETHVAQDEQVEAGRVLGLMGSTGRSTGPHLHWEVWYDGRAYDPMPALRALSSVDPGTGAFRAP